MLQRRNPVLLLTTVGRRSGRPLTTPLNYSRAGNRLVVIASAGGAARHPAWYHNLVALPDVVVEHDGQTFRARATVAEEPERTRLYDRHAAAMPFFDSYRRRVTSREIPVVILERTGAHHVVYPETAMGERVAHLVTGKMIDFIEFDDGFAIVKTRAPREAEGRTLAECALRSKYGVTVVGVKRPRTDFTYAKPETAIQQGDLLIVSGPTKLVEAFAALT